MEEKVREILEGIQATAARRPPAIDREMLAWKILDMLQNSIGIYLSHRVQQMLPMVAENVAALSDSPQQGCEGCSYKRSQLDGLLSVQCLGCSYNYPSHYTPTEPKE